MCVSDNCESMLACALLCQDGSLSERKYVLVFDLDAWCLQREPLQY